MKTADIMKIVISSFGFFCIAGFFYIINQLEDKKDVNNIEHTQLLDDVFSELIKEDFEQKLDFKNHNITLYHYAKKTDEGARILVQTIDSVITIDLPLTDSEVKNFSVDSFKETKDGFSIATSYGGGKNYYSRKFFFEIDASNDEIFFYKLKGSYSNYTTHEKQNGEKLIDPKISLSNFNLLSYLENSKI